MSAPIPKAGKVSHLWKPLIAPPLPHPARPPALNMRRLLRCIRLASYPEMPHRRRERSRHDYSHDRRLCSQAALSPSSDVSLFDDDFSKEAATVPKMEVHCSTKRNPILLAPHPMPRAISCTPWRHEACARARASGIGGGGGGGSSAANPSAAASHSGRPRRPRSPCAANAIAHDCPRGPARRSRSHTTVLGGTARVLQPILIARIRRGARWHPARDRYSPSAPFPLHDR